MMQKCLAKYIIKGIFIISKEKTYAGFTWKSLYH